MPRTRNNHYEKKRKQRKYIKQTQEKAKELKNKIRILKLKDEQLNNQISNLEIKIQNLTVDNDNFKNEINEVERKLSNLTKDYNNLLEFSEKYSNRLLMELKQTVDEYNLLQR